jgi:hypothetical protein
MFILIIPSHLDFELSNGNARWERLARVFMKFIDKFIRTVEIALRRSPFHGEAEDMDIKQNTPPDDHDAEMYEVAQEHENEFSGVGAQGSDGKNQTKKAGTGS